MTPDTTAEAIRALTQAVEGLRASIASQIPWPAWMQVGATAVLVVVTWVYVRHTGRMATESTNAAKSAGQSAEAARDLVRLEGEKLALARDREARERENDKRLLAGALAAELQGFLVLWDEIESPEQPAEGFIMTWAVEQSYTVIFDTAGPRLFLLGPELIRQTTAAYARMKRGLDNLRLSARLTEWASTSGRQAGTIHGKPIGRMTLDASEAAVKTARRAVEAIREVLPRLDAVADPKQAEGQPT